MLLLISLVSISTEKCQQIVFQCQSLQRKIILRTLSTLKEMNEKTSHSARELVRGHREHDGL